MSALSGVPSTDAAGLARRLGAEQLAGVEAGSAAITARAFEMFSAERREVLSAGPVTIDMDSTDVEVYARGKQGVAYNYQASASVARTLLPGPRAGWC